MKAWLRALRGMRWLALAGLLVALAVAVSRGQALPSQLAECGEPPSWTSPGYPEGEPPMIGSPISPQSPAPPFTPPSPRPLPPGETMPFVPHMPAPVPEPLGPPEPIVRLRIGAPSRVEPGKEIEYRLTVENISRADAHHVVLRDRLPHGVKEAVRAEPKATKNETKGDVTDLLWELGTLKAGDHKTIVLAIKPTGTEEVENRAYVQFEHGQKVITRIAKPGVQVKVTVPAQTMKYESIHFRIEVVNTGAVPLRNVVLTDEVPAGLEFFESQPPPNSEKPLTWKLGDLPPQQTRRVEYQVISKQTGTFRNKAKVTAEGGASATGSGTVTVLEPKMKITIRGPQRRLVNRPIPYHITVLNLGSVALTQVQVAAELPGGVKFDSVDAGGRKEGEFVRWSLGTLPPGEHRPLRLVLRAAETGSCWIQAQVDANNHLSDKACSEAKIQSANTPVIEIDKDTDSLVVGQKATYTIRLFNPGNRNVLRPSVIVSASDEMRIQGQRGPTTGGNQGQQVHFDPLTALDAGKEELYYVEVEAVKAGVAKLRAWWTDGSPGSRTPDAWEDHTTILAPAAASDTATPRQLSASGGRKPPESLHREAYGPRSRTQ